MLWVSCKYIGRDGEGFKDKKPKHYAKKKLKQEEQRNLRDWEGLEEFLSLRR